MCHKNMQGQKRSRGRPRQFDRDLALHTALKVFWEHGYANTTIAMLCESLALTSPSIYCAFGNKEDLFLEALRFYRKTYWLDEFDDFLANDDFKDAVLRFFKKTAEILLKPEAPCGCLTVLTALNPPCGQTKIIEEVGRMREHTRSVFRKRCAAAGKAGQVPQKEVEALASALLNFFEGMSIQARSGCTQEELMAMAVQGARLAVYP